MFTLSFSMENAAFDELPMTECARILRKVASTVQAGAAIDGNIQDVHGNTIGAWSIRERDRRAEG